MTEQEKAIEQLERISEHLSAIGEKEDYTDIAIKALETQEQAIKEAYDKGYEYGVKEWFDKRTKSQTCIEDYPTCTECEHYDREKHYCPRFCQVIKDTLAEAQPSEDCISREEAKQFLYERIDRLNDDELYDIFSRIIDDMYNELPSVTPQRPKGKWIETPVENDIVPVVFKCSECGMRVINPYKYCPNCGSYNGGNDNGDE